MNLKNSLLIRFALLIILSATLAGVSGCGGAKPILENVVVRDTIVVTKERILHDTLTLKQDTIIYQDRVKVQVKYLEGERIVIEAECPTDTIKVEKIVLSTKNTKNTKSKDYTFYLGWLLVILSFLVILRVVLNYTFGSK